MRMNFLILALYSLKSSIGSVIVSAQLGAVAARVRSFVGAISFIKRVIITLYITLYLNYSNTAFVSFNYNYCILGVVRDLNKQKRTVHLGNATNILNVRTER